MDTNAIAAAPTPIAVSCETYHQAWPRVVHHEGILARVQASHQVAPCLRLCTISSQTRAALMAQLERLGFVHSRPSVDEPQERPNSFRIALSDLVVNLPPGEVEQFVTTFAREAGVKFIARETYMEPVLQLYRDGTRPVFDGLEAMTALDIARAAQQEVDQEKRRLVKATTAQGHTPSNR